MGSETNVKCSFLAPSPQMSNDDDGPGINTGHFVIAVTAVAANSVDDPDANEGEELNTAHTANILFPTAPGCGYGWDRQHRQWRRDQDCCWRSNPPYGDLGPDNNRMYTMHGANGVQ